MPALEPFYPGTQDRLAAIKTKCPDAVSFTHLHMLLIKDVDAPGGGGDYMLRNEAFAPALAIKYVDGGNDPAAFLQLAVEFANTRCFGSLSTTVLVDPTTMAALGPKVRSIDLYPSQDSDCSLSLSLVIDRAAR